MWVIAGCHSSLKTGNRMFCIKNKNVQNAFLLLKFFGLPTSSYLGTP